MVAYEQYYTEGKKRTDVTPVFSDGAVFARLVDDMLSRCAFPFTKIAGIDALGFILGSAMAIRAGKGFIPIRKGGKLPERAERVDFVDYSGKRKQLELSYGALSPEDTVLIVDDWIETGTQMRAAAQLVERQGARVAGIAVLSAERTKRTEGLFEKYPLVTLHVMDHG
jgi:adenine phosphoribosyltransferase